MPTPRCSNDATCLHDLARDRDNGDDCECEESDPSGRYVRYKEVLGRGAFKTVYRAFDEIEGIEVAWNQIKLQSVVRSSEDLERLLSEVHLLKALKHKNIIKFYQSWVDMDAQHINFITEVFTSGTLRQYRQRHKHMDIRAVKNWSRQILRGLLYLHSHDPPIIHRDLKCDNIFINGNQGEVKIGDLGLAAILHQAHSAHSVIGTPEFMAPEFYEEEYTELVDIYSFGMCLLEMATFEYPYSECTNAAQIYKKVTSGEKPAALKKVKDPYLRQFVEKCLASASRRLSARELLMDPFLQYNNDQDLLEPCLGFSKSMVNVGDIDVIETLMGKRNHSAPLLVRENDLATQHSRSVNMPTVADFKEKKSRSMDFRVKGKKRENDTVHLRIRIADSEGEVRIIHFPFDVESDTAMCVASEMVAELELADQDVTTIAEMIDTAVLAMVPEWKPGVAIDEGVEGEELGDEPFPNNQFQKSQWSPDHLSTVSFESMFTDHSHHPQIDNMMHGRFEEVMYHSHTPECRIHLDEEQGVTPMELGLTEWQQGDELNPSGSTGSFDFKDSALSDQGHGVLGSVYNRAIKSIRLARCNGKRWIADDLCALIMDRKRQIDCCVRELYHQTARHTSYSRKAVNQDDSNELVKQELRTLAHQYAQDLKELQCKHETAFLAWRKRWQEKGDVLYFEVQQDE